jgi:uncharacterized cofD-like protein
MFIGVVQLLQLPERHPRIRAAFRHHAPRLKRSLKWLTPGLAVKRWWLLSAIGCLLTGIGIAIGVEPTPIHTLLLLSFHFVTTIAHLIPNWITALFLITLGVGLMYVGHTHTVRMIADTLQPTGHAKLIDRLMTRRRLRRGPKIVAIGGGTGLSTLLRGLKAYSSNITAIVTVADDGGSSGRLRRDIGVLPPGDIRNCLAALADEERLLTDLFQYRFQTGAGLEGHSFGNLFLAVLSDITGDLEQAIAASSKVLAVRGRVLPATLSDVHLWAELADGRVIHGESNISEAGGQIRQIGCSPANPPALPAAIQAIQEADYIILGPGSLYTSIIPNLLVPEIQAAIAKAQVPRVYICNVMTQPGETDGFRVSDHIEAIDQACGQRLFDTVLVHQGTLSAHSLLNYAQVNAYPVWLDREAVHELGRQVISGHVIDEDPDTGYVRHQPQRLAHSLMKWYHRNRMPQSFQQLRAES